MPENVFKVGDVVRLKSGGPLMTVNEIDDEKDMIYCQWFVDKKSESGGFKSETLSPSKPAGPVGMRSKRTRPIY